MSALDESRQQLLAFLSCGPEQPLRAWLWRAYLEEHKLTIK